MDDRSNPRSQPLALSARLLFCAGVLVGLIGLAWAIIFSVFLDSGGPLAWWNSRSGFGFRIPLGILPAIPLFVCAAYLVIKGCRRSGPEEANDRSRLLIELLRVRAEDDLNGIERLRQLLLDIDCEVDDSAGEDLEGGDGKEPLLPTDSPDDQMALAGAGSSSTPL